MANHWVLETLIIFTSEETEPTAEYEQFIAERARLEKGCGERKRKQTRKIEQKTKVNKEKKDTEDGER